MSLSHRVALYNNSHTNQIRLLPQKTEGRHIKAMIFLRGFTQKEIAAGLGISPVNIHNVIHGKIRSARIESEIARILGKASWNDVVLEARAEVQKKPVAVIVREMQRERDTRLKAAKKSLSGHISQRMGEIEVTDLRSSRGRKGA